MAKITLQDLNFKKIMEWPFNLQIIFFAAVTGIIVLLFGIYEIINYGRMKVFYRESETQVLTGFKKNLESQAANKIDLKTYAEAKKQLTKFNNAITPESKLQEVLGSLSKQGINLGIKFSSFETENVAPTTGMHYALVKLDAIGSYDQLASFLSTVANMDNLVLINDFNFSQTVADDKSAISIVQNGLIKCNLTMNIYEKTV